MTGTSNNHRAADWARRERDAAGDQPGVTDLVGISERFRGALERYFRKRVHDREEVDDLVQEVFCRLASRPDGIRIENPEAYLFQTAANLLRDLARRDGARREPKEQIRLQEQDKFEEISPERVLLGKQRVALLQDALNELPERTRAIFLLHRFEDFKYGEIASRLGISTSLVEKHMMDAIKHLTIRMGRE